MNTKPYLLTAFSDTGRGEKEYFKTLIESGVADQVEPIIVNYMGKADTWFPDDLYPHNAQIIRIPRGYEGNLARFLPFIDAIRIFKLDLSRWFIFSDTSDVIFQSEINFNPCSYNEIIVTDEGRNFSQIDFWKQYLPEELTDKSAFNVGLFAMKGDVFLKYLQDVETKWKWIRRRIKTEKIFPYSCEYVRHQIGGIFNYYGDTIFFNHFVQQHKFEIIPQLFSCVAYNLEDGNLTRHRGKYYYHDPGKSDPVSIVHANGSTKDKRLIHKFIPFWR